MLKVSVLGVLLLSVVRVSQAQSTCRLDDLTCLKNLATGFPSFDNLSAPFQSALDTKLSLQPGIEHRASPGDPDVGAAAGWKTGLWDNLTIHVDATGTNTLSNQLNTAGTGLTKFQLTGVTFIPTAYIQYQTTIGQLISAKRQSHAGHNLAAGKALFRESETEKLRKAYALFQELRAEFIEKLDSQTASLAAVEAKQRLVDAKRAEVRACDPGKSCENAQMATALATAEAALADARAAAITGNVLASSFMKMKIQALEVFSLANYPGREVTEWMSAGN